MIDGLGADLPGGAFAGRVAVITGAGQGIGREVALLLARLGAKVIIAEIEEAAGMETERLAREAGEALFVHTDVSNEDSVALLARRTANGFGPPDVLINGAIVSPVSSLLDTSVATWDRVMAVNLRGAFLTCRAFLPAMLEKDGGAIVNMVSADAMAFMSAYIASKQGLVGFSQSLAAEVGPARVRVIAFAPGMVDTPGLRNAARDLAPRLDMPVADFLSMTIEPERAALATAYLLLWAGEYHGQAVDAYEILERAKAAAGGGGETSPGVEPVTPPHEVPAALTAAKVQAMEKARELSERLGQVIFETGEEMGRLPVFVRPLAARGFQRKAGMTTEAWQRLIVDIRGHLEQMERESESAGAIAALRAHYSHLEDSLYKLRRYYEEAPGEFSRFTRDRAAVAAVQEISDMRVGIIDSLLAAIARIVQ